jgi:hypothetical protein
MDRRQHERYEVNAPLCYSWRRAGNAWHDMQGVVHDISGGGVFISTPDPPPVGTTVRFCVFFSSFVENSKLVMEATARVVRLDVQKKAPPGFAAALKAYTLRNEEEIIEQVS